MKKLAAAKEVAARTNGGGRGKTCAAMVIAVIDSAKDNATEAQLLSAIMHAFKTHLKVKSNESKAIRLVKRVTKVSEGMHDNKLSKEAFDRAEQNSKSKEMQVAAKEAWKAALTK